MDDLAGVINSHLIMGYLIANHGTDEQKKRFLPAMAAVKSAAASRYRTARGQ